MNVNRENLEINITIKLHSLSRIYAATGTIHGIFSWMIDQIYGMISNILADLTYVS